jgi:hypothetical protein
MMRVGVISNPRSRRNRDSMGRMRTVIARHQGVAHVELSRMEELPDALRRLAGLGVTLLVVSGGDGTVHAVLTELLNDGPFAPVPRLAVLPSGMANAVAGDVGLAGPPERSLDRLLTLVREGGRLAVRRRQVLSLIPTPGARPCHGMFFGTGAFYRTVKAGRQRIHPTGARHALATALALGLFAVEALIRRSSPGSTFGGDRLTISLDGGAPRTAMRLGMIATTLERLTLGLNPFWGGGAGRLRYTLFPYPPPRFACALLPILRGRPRPWMAAAGYESGRADELALTLDCPLVLDGEIYAGPAERPAVLRADRSAEFVTLDG